MFLNYRFFNRQPAGQRSPVEIRGLNGINNALAVFVAYIAFRENILFKETTNLHLAVKESV